MIGRFCLPHKYQLVGFRSSGGIDCNDYDPDGELQGYKGRIGQPGKEFKNGVTFISNVRLTVDGHY